MALFNRRVAVAAAAVLVVMTGGVWAHGEATGVVKERMDMMKSMGDAMKALKPMVTGGGEVDRKAVADHAATIAGHAETIPAKFPEGSLQGVSEAKPEIWTEWDDFTSDAEELKTAARELEQAAGSAEPGTLRDRFVAVAKTCRDCHGEFRKDEDK